MHILGFISIAFGVLVVALGWLWRFLGYRFGDAVLWWSLMWGLTGIGVGLVLLGTSRRALAAAGVLVSGVSLGMTAYWHFRVAPLLSEWLWGISVPNGFGILYGIAAFVTKTLRRASP
jgi:hypothetical protein